MYYVGPVTAGAAPRILKHQVVRAELDRMLDGMRIGDPFPAEREIAEQFEVARETVRQALRELLIDGRVERRGRTTVVARPKIRQPLGMGSYTEAAKAQGLSAGRILVAWSDLTADEVLAGVLGVDVGAPVLQLERVLTTDGVRVGLETTKLPAQRYPGLRETFDHEASLYAEIRSRGIAFTRTSTRSTRRSRTRGKRPFSGPTRALPCSCSTGCPTTRTTLPSSNGARCIAAIG